MPLPQFKIRKVVAFLVLGLLVVSLTATFLARRTIQVTLDEYAEKAAISWGTYLSESLYDINSIASGLPPSARSLSILGISQRVGDIFRYKIFNAEGQLVLISDDLDYRFEGEADLSDHNPLAARVISTGETYIDVREGNGDTRPPHYSEAYVPLVVDGEAVGIIEVYVDQTANRAHLLTSLGGLSLQLILAMVLAFGVPSLWYLKSSKRQVETETELHHASHHDRLTGTRNRTRFTADVEQMIDDGQTVTIYVLDLDYFKAINDHHGQHVGDKVLRQTGKRLEKLIGDTGIVGRPSGDEFSIAQPHSLRPTSSCSNFAMFIQQALAEPFYVDDLTIECRCSIGFAASPHHGDSAALLMQRASVALDQAKREGRNRALRYDQIMEVTRKKQLNLESLLREAMQADLFTLNYQPQFGTLSGDLTGFEALLRLNDHDGAPIGPDKFIPVAEEMGLISELGEWVLRKACSFAALWPDPIMVAVNLSAIQFEDGKLVQTVKTVLEETGLPAKKLELEITESLLIDDTDNVITQLHELRAMGIKIALDDFGTGYSSLSYLWKFPFDTLKIDRSFVMQIEKTDGKAYDILQSIVSLAQSLNLEITAEGVETLKQLDVLKDMKATNSQGFLLGRPMPEVDVPSLIMSKTGILPDLPVPARLSNIIRLAS